MRACRRIYAGRTGRAVGVDISEGCRQRSFLWAAGAPGNGRPDPEFVVNGKIYKHSFCRRPGERGRKALASPRTADLSPSVEPPTSAILGYATPPDYSTPSNNGLNRARFKSIATKTTPPASRIALEGPRRQYVYEVGVVTHRQYRSESFRRHKGPNDTCRQPGVDGYFSTGQQGEGTSVKLNIHDLAHGVEGSCRVAVHNRGGHTHVFTIAKPLAMAGDYQVYPPSMASGD